MLFMCMRRLREHQAWIPYVVTGNIRMSIMTRVITVTEFDSEVGEIQQISNPNDP